MAKKKSKVDIKNLLKNKKVLFGIALVVAALATIGYFTFASGGCTIGGGTTTCPTLRYGSRGDAVRLLQTMLNRNCSTGPVLKVDGIFGNGTKSNVIGFQRDYNRHYSVKLAVDGIVGAKTWNALSLVYNNGGHYPGGEEPAAICR